MRKLLLLIFFALGFFSLLSQTLIIREFIISFGGNELGIGLFYFFWLFWVGAGAYLALTRWGKFLSRHFLKLLFLYPLLAFLEIFLFVSLRHIAGVSWWELFSLEKIFIYLFTFTSAISFFTGIIFAVGVLWLKKIKQSQTTSEIIASSYIYEALGSFVAGCAVTLLILKLASPINILLAGSLIFALLALSVSARFKERLSIILHSVLVALILILFWANASASFQALRVKSILPQGELIEEVYTPYQHLVLTRLDNQLIVLSNGAITSSIPQEIEPDKEAALFVSQASSAKRVLVLGYGVENLINSLLKLPLESVTYCLQDKVYYDRVFSNLPPKTKRSLTNPRLEVVFQAPRLFLKEESEKFDLVIIYTPDPSSLIINSFFTAEFYSLLKDNLRHRGVVATRITSAENYLGEEIRNYGSSLYYTLSEVFPRIVILPGEINWFFAGSTQSAITDDPTVLEDRFKGIIPQGYSFPPQGFASLFLPRRVEFTKKMYRDNPLFKNVHLINRDQKPLAFFLNLLVMARYSQSYLVVFLKNALLAGAFIFLIPLVILFIARLHFLLRIENIRTRRRAFNAKLFQFFSGFLGFSFHLALIYLFQSKLGTIFQLIGLVNGLFMLGLCLGAAAAKAFSKRITPQAGILVVVAIQALIILLAYPIFIKTSLAGGPLLSLFYLFFLGSGIVTGSSYSLSARVLEEGNVPLKVAASHLELLDHWGGSLGGLLAGLFMLPLLGVLETLVVLFVVALIIAIFFLLELAPLSILTRERKPHLLSFPYIRTSYVLAAIALSFLISFYFLEKKRDTWRTRGRLVTGVAKDDCYLQQEPFPAEVCPVGDDKEYILETKDFAPGVKGFAGPINLLLTASSSGEIKEIKVIEHVETLSYIGNLDSFLEQFKGKILGERVSFDEVDAITGATITSRAVVDIINQCGDRLAQSFGREVSGEKAGIVVDTPSIYLILFTLVAVILYIYYPSIVARRVYLVLVVIFSGFFFNFVFSFAHLVNLLNLNLSSSGSLAHLLIYLIPLVLGVLFGQLWCGWLCPFGALQELVGGSSLNKKISPALDKRARYFKYIFLAFFVIVIAMRRDANLFAEEPLSVFFQRGFVIDRVRFLSIIVLVLAVFFRRFWCRYFCVCGAFLSLFNRIALLKRFFIKRYNRCPFGETNLHSIDCIQCNLCKK